MFCASLSNTPQLVIGGRSPRPRNDSAVSPRIMPGMTSVADAIKWLIKLGNRWRPMIRAGLAPINTAAVQKSSSRSDSSFERTARARRREHQVKIARHEAPKRVFVAAAEKTDGVVLRRVRGVDPTQIGHVQLVVVAGHIRPSQAAVGEDVHPLRRRVDVVGVAAVE